MARKYGSESVPLSRFGVLVAQLESIVASAAQQPPEPVLCFDLLSDLISAIEEEPKESLLLCQRKCEDALYSLLTLGARRPVRHLASVAMAKIISKGDAISIYSRVSSLQGFLSDGKKSEPQRVAGAAQCLGELYKHFGRRITSGLLETTMIATKLIKFYEEFVRQEALYMLQNALEGSGGSAASSAYTEAFRLVMRFAIGDKAFVVRIAAARCLKAFANIGGPGLGVAELENSASFCVKALEDPVSSVRDAFSEALGSLLALGMSPEAQVQPRGKGPVPPAKKLEGFLQRHLALPFVKASGARSKDVRVGLTLSWVFFLQAIHLKYQHPESELQTFALQVMDMLRADTSVDAHALACVLYILRVGVTDQLMEPTQRSFLVFLGKQLQSPDASPSMKISALCTLSYTLKSLGEVPFEFKEVLDDTVVAAISHPSQLVRIEASLTLRTLAEVDLTCVGGLISFGVTTLNALRENISFEKGSNLQFELDSLHGQASVLAALVSVLPKLPLGYPARLPRSILEVSKKMLTEPSRNLVAAAIEKEAGWLLLSSLLASMPKEEIEDQVFDVLSLWASVFSGNLEQETKQTGDLRSKICVWSAAVDALTAFVRCFVCLKAVNSGILLQPVLVYLSSALSYITVATAKEMPNVKPALDIFVIKTLIAYQSLPDPLAYKNDHPRLMQLCTTPFRVASGCEESSCLRLLLDKRDAWLGPWIPGRDWFEDELRAFQGGKDGLMPCVWENELSSFPQPETISKTLVNQMLLCFGVIFASQDSAGMLSLLGMMDHCRKTGKKQSCHAASVTNICIGLLAGFKALLSLRPQPLAPEILGSAQAIFQSVLAEGDICASQRRASSEGLGLLARLGNDMFTARMTRSLLGDLTGAIDSNYAGSIAIALGCLHRSAGGMALSTLVPATVSSISLLAKSSVASLQIWSLHGLLLTIEAAGLSFVTHVPATLGLAMDILLSDENGWVELQQGVGRLINAVVAIIGPELAPGSIFFSRCKSVVAEISSCQETATMLESVRFTQQLVLFAPQAVSVHSHVQSLLPTLSSRQPTLRHLALSTLRHLIEKDPVSIIVEEIEDNLFHMLDEETDSEIGNLARTTIMRLLYASCPSRPSHWIYVCRSMVLALPARRIDNYKKVMNDPSNDPDGETRQNLGDDDENMVSSSEGMKRQGYRFESSSMMPTREKHLRYRTRVFAAECLSHLPGAVGKNPAHFDLSLARKQPANRQVSSDWLVLHVQELISLAYQISTIQFEHMRPIGVGLLSMIIDKFERIQDPELLGHLLLEQYQAQLVSAVRTALDFSAGPLLLEAGLQLATKILTSGVISGDQVAVKRIFSLISRPLNDFNELYYPSFAEWVSCKIKIRLLAAHASLKCYTYAFLRRHHSMIPDEYLALLPLFSKNSNILGKYWIQVLKDYSYVCLCLHRKKTWSQFLEGIQSPLVSSKLQPCLEESWPVILQALALDSVPLNLSTNEQSKASVEDIAGSLVSGYNMVELEPVEFHFLWGFSLLVLFQGQNLTLGESKLPLFYAKAKHGEDSSIEELDPPGFNLYEIVLPVFQCLATERYFSVGFLTMDISRELLQVLSYATYTDSSFNSLAISVLSQVVQNCPEDFLDIENFAFLAMELCFTYLFKMFQSTAATSPDQPNWYELISSLFFAAKTLLKRLESKLQKQLESMVLAFLLIGFKCIREASTDLCFSEVNDFVKCTVSSLEKLISENSKLGDEGSHYLRAILGTCLNVLANLIKECIKGIHLLDNKRSDLRKLLQMKLSFSVEQTISFAKLVHGIRCLGSNGSDAIYFTLLKYCTECIRMSLVDSNIQVQAIGLQVLKTTVQRALIPEENTFVIFLVGEQIGDIFTLIEQMLKKPLTKESVAVVSECLRILVLLQTLSKGSKSQGGFINLLFEAIVMVFLASEAEFSQEVSDLRSITLKLVSHIAQIPSSAVHFKDVLLSMPPMHRQKLQGVILDSVSQDHNVSQMKPLAPVLEVKLSVPTEGTEEKHSPVLASTVPSDKNSTEEDGEDEDDWDSFQSFPASTNAAGNESGVVSSAKDPGPVENSSIPEIGTGSDDSKEFSISKSLNNAEHPEAGEEEVIADSPGSQVSPQCDAPSHRIGMHEIHRVTQPFHDQLQEKEEEVVQSQGKEAISRQENEQILTDRQPVEVGEGSVGVNVAEDHEVGKDIPDTKLDQTLSGSLPLQELCGETHGEGNCRTEGEPDEAYEATQKKMDENNVTEQQQDNVDNLGIPRS